MKAEQISVQSHQSQNLTNNLENTVSIDRGSILVYRVFDIAEEVDLVSAEQKLMQGGGETRVRLAPAARNSVVVKNAPIRVTLGEMPLQVGTESFRADVVATLWDYGALSIAFQLHIPKGTTWNQLLNFAALIMEDGNKEKRIDAAAIQKAADISRLLKASLKKQSEWQVSEDYVIYFLEQIQGITTPSELPSLVNIPGLILGEPTEILAEKNREGILDNIYQYAANDMVVIDWNSALVIEPNGNRDITDVLEFALTHLLEVRYYDDLLDKRLTELYEVLEVRRRTKWRSYFANTSQETNTRFLEFSEFMERIDNSLKVVGDFYLAVIFRAAARRFRIPDWQQSITRKMNLLARVSELLQGEVNVHRGHMLEIIIIFLFLFEIVSAFHRNI